MSGLVNTMKGAALNIGQMLTPVLKESRFQETGVLTPEEFVCAGDHLVHHCPTWQWARAVDSSRTKSYLPEEKQFLITRNVPCHRRCRHMEYDESQEKILTTSEVNEDGFEDGDVDSGWVDTHHYASDASQKAEDMDQGQQGAVSSRATVVQEPMTGGLDDDDDDGPAMDMDELVADGGLLEADDPYRFVQSRPAVGGTSASSAAGRESAVLHTRTYDLHITYDKYYQVPRLWLSGYNENRQPLTIEEMNEDFSQDHANKTITIETHPHLHSAQMASIHPCRHADVMKRLIEQLADSGRELSVHQYLLIFLKFVQAVIPTIEYDYTRSIQL